MSIVNPNLESVFAAAIELPELEVDSFVRRECAEDGALLKQVTELLVAYRRNEGSDWLNGPVVPETSGPLTIPRVTEQVGETIGRYTLIEEIGEGGMGVVYLAKQQVGVQREVALKIVKPGMDTRQVIARFEIERQALSRFSHPNIARVYDAGVTDMGRPYFVMELVNGKDISSYVQENGLPLNDRLGLFVDVCQAVHHAHQKGIIHRDLKPSNVLVDTTDTHAVPKVIDFGIAKAVGEDRLTEQTLVTQYAAMLGTPSYMSPEQANPDSSDIDIRTDVYSLGVLIYKLLTGTTPYSARNLSSRGSQITEADRDATEAPSMQITRSAGKPGAHEGDLARRTEPELSIRPELDWIVLKALSPERDKRYASASEFAADIQRFMADEPVLAAPPARFYKLRSFVRRHRWAVTATAVGFGCLLMLMAVCFYLAIDARQANSKLVAANNKLENRNIQLSEAQINLALAFDEQAYAWCIEIAYEKFDNDFYYDKIDEIESRLHKEWLAETSKLEQRRHKPQFDTIPCFYFEDEILLALPDECRLVPLYARIHRWMDRENTLYDQIYEEALEVSPIEEPVHEHTPLCLKYHHRLREQVKPLCVEFYRTLMKELSKSFGPEDSRVAGAWNLLALSLVEAKQYKEATECLNVSRRIGDADNAKTVDQLQCRIEELTASPPVG